MSSQIFPSWAPTTEPSHSENYACVLKLAPDKSFRDVKFQDFEEHELDADEHAQEQARVVARNHA